MDGGIIRDDDGDYNKRLLALLVLFVVVVIGAGVGTLGLTSDGPTPDRPDIETTPVPPEPTATPEGGGPERTETPADADGSGSGPPVDDLTETASTPTPTDSDSDDGADGPADGSVDGGGDSGGSGGDGDGGGVSLETRGTTVLLQSTAFAPGDTATGTVDVRNSGSTAGTLGVSNVTVTDDENGLEEPERAVGDTRATGELSDHLQVRLWITDANGTREYLVGSASATETMASLDGTSERGTRAVAGGDTATLGIEVTLPAATGNEVQSDRVELTVPLVLEELRS